MPSHPTPINLNAPIDAAPSSSWWTHSPAEGFTARCYQEHPRMRHSKFAQWDDLTGLNRRERINEAEAAYRSQKAARERAEEAA